MSAAAEDSLPPARALAPEILAIVEALARLAARMDHARAGGDDACDLRDAIGEQAEARGDLR